jgi:hypothetical protein
MLKAYTEYDEQNVIMMLTEEINILDYKLAFKCWVATNMDSGERVIQLGSFQINDGYQPIVEDADKPAVISQLNSWMDELISLSKSMKVAIHLHPYDERAARLWARYGFVTLDDEYMIRNI